MRWMALLRGVNVGGNRRLPMAELRSALEKEGYCHVVTLLASGNVVLTTASGGTRGAALEKTLEALLHKHFGLTTDVMVRSGTEWAQVVAANPFHAEAAQDPSHMVVGALKDAPSPRAARAWVDAHPAPEKLHVHGREAFIVYGPSMADSALKLDGLGVPGTARNWNTTRKLLAALQEP